MHGILYCRKNIIAGVTQLTPDRLQTLYRFIRRTYNLDLEKVIVLFDGTKDLNLSQVSYLTDPSRKCRGQHMCDFMVEIIGNVVSYDANFVL